MGVGSLSYGGRGVLGRSPLPTTLSRSLRWGRLGYCLLQGERGGGGARLVLVGLATRLATSAGRPGKSQGLADLPVDLWLVEFVYRCRTY